MHGLRCLYVLLVFPIASASARERASSHVVTPIPEMARLAEVLAGDWNNAEILEASDRFPSGARRRGISHCELNTGGTTLVCQGTSDGSAGKLDHLIVIWWDEGSKDYGFFVCF